MGEYVVVSAELPEALAELAAYELHEAEAGGVELRDGETLPPPGMKALPPGRALVVGYFGADVDGDALAQALQARLALEDAAAELRIGAARLPDEAWHETWRLHFKPVHVKGALWVVPPWEKVPDGAIAVVIEPGMAFGTGGHATTLLCLRGVHDAVRADPAGAVLDVGCGSGVLAIAAALLGAKEVLQIDNDPIAVQVAIENAEKNGVPFVRSGTTPVEEVTARFPLVVANILANTLIDLCAPIVARVSPGGTLLLSGVLCTQADEVTAAYVARGCTSVRRDDEGEWSMITLRAP